MAGKSTKRRQATQQSQMGQVLSLLQRMAVAGPSQPKRRPRRRNNRRRNQVNQAAPIQQDGTVSLSRTELIASLVLPGGNVSAKGHIDLVPSSFAFLKGLFKSFDRIRWLKLVVFYKPAVGTVYGGLVSVGMDWDFASDDVARTSLSGFTPNFTTAAWQDTQTRPMVLPPARMQSQNWYTPTSSDATWTQKGPGKLHWALDGTKDTAARTVGELWVSYSVQLMGTNPA